MVAFNPLWSREKKCLFQIDIKNNLFHYAKALLVPYQISYFKVHLFMQLEIQTVNKQPLILQ